MKRSLQIAVVDDDAAFRDVLSRHLSIFGHSAACFPSVERCLPHLTRAQVDLITLDIRMPRICGLTLLSALFERGHALPILVISAEADPKQLEKVQRFGAHFLAKPFTPMQLKDAIEIAMSGVDASAKATPRDAARRRTERNAPPRKSGVTERRKPAASKSDPHAGYRNRIMNAELPVVDPRIMGLQEILTRPDAPGFEELAKTLGEDPRLVSAVLRVANSAEFRGTKAIASLQIAMARLGSKEVVGIVLQVLLRSTFGVKDDVLRSCLDADWEESVACAHLCRALAGQSLRVNPDEGYVYGLLHDVGRLAIYSCLDGSGVDEEVARDLVERHHELVGGRLLAEWEVPRALMELARAHHDDSIMTVPVMLCALARDIYDGIEPKVEHLARLGISRASAVALMRDGGEKDDDSDSEAPRDHSRDHLRDTG